MIGDSVWEMVFDLGGAECILDESPPMPSPAATVPVAVAATTPPVATPILCSSSAPTSGVASFRGIPCFVG